MWYEVVRKYSLTDDSKLLIWPFQTHKFKPGELDKTFARWRDKGMTAMCTLVEGQHLKSFEKLQREFDLDNGDLFRYFQLRNFYDSEIKKRISTEGNQR